MGIEKAVAVAGSGFEDPHRVLRIDELILEALD